MTNREVIETIVDRFEGKYNPDNNLMPGAVVVTWADFELLILIEKLLELIDKLDERINKLERKV